MRKRADTIEMLEVQPDAVEVEQQKVPGRIRWVLYVVLLTIIIVVLWASLFSVDRIVSADGNLITTSPTIMIQPLNTAIVRSIDVQIGDVVGMGQVLATLDSTFAKADLSQLKKQDNVIRVQVRRIQSELRGIPFHADVSEGEDGQLQEDLFNQRVLILQRNMQLNKEKNSMLHAELKLNQTQRQGKKKRLKILRDVEGTTARQPKKGNEYRLKLLEVQKNVCQVNNELESLVAQEQVVLQELKQTEAEWSRFIDERIGELMEQEVQLSNDLQKIDEEINKAQRLHDLVVLKAPEKAIVLDLGKRSVGSIVKQAEPFITLVPINSSIEAEVKIASRDIARIRTGDSVRVKLEAFPFQRHDTLPGEVRVISEDAFRAGDKDKHLGNYSDGFYRTRIKLLSRRLKHVPEGFRLMPGMSVKAEIKIGQRSIISYFLYPIIRLFDESLREP